MMSVAAQPPGLVTSKVPRSRAVMPEPAGLLIWSTRLLWLVMSPGVLKYRLPLLFQQLISTFWPTEPIGTATAWSWLLSVTMTHWQRYSAYKGVLPALVPVGTRKYATSAHWLL